MNKRILKRHKRQVLRAQRQVPSMAAREDSRRLACRHNAPGALYSGPSIRTHVGPGVDRAVTSEVGSITLQCDSSQRAVHIADRSRFEVWASGTLSRKPSDGSFSPADALSVVVTFSYSDGKLPSERPPRAVSAPGVRSSFLVISAC